MTVTIRAYDAMGEQERNIRTLVFVRESAWRPEFDEWDEPGASTHLLASDDAGSAVGTCRFYLDAAAEPHRHVIARLAVLGTARGHGVGSALLDEAESRIAALGGDRAWVHAEFDYYPFYERHGYILSDDVYDDGRHGWLRKPLRRGLNGPETHRRPPTEIIK